jgi:uncharacterized protein YfaS (alpha-2-macroglobulin family)
MRVSRWIVAVAVWMTVSVSVAGPRQAQWKEVDEAVNKGLPKTAIEKLEPIIAGAMKDKAYAEAIKAIAKKIALEGNIEGNKPEEKVVRLEAEIAKAPAEMKPVMQAILAHWYWHYFQQNRWRFLQRTRTAEPPGEDFTTWDLPRILAEVDKHFTAALANEQQLKSIAIAQFNDLLQRGTVPDSYRPTLFDFLAHEALQFYQAGEQGAAAVEDEFELMADSPVFGTVGEFLQWNPDATDETSPRLKAIRLYQKLLAFHADDEDSTAFIDADLHRLNFGHNVAVGPDKAERYKAALKRFVEEWADHEISARAMFHWATVLHGEDELVEAHRLARRGAEVFPNSVGGIWCFNLMKQIEARSVSISTERVWNQPMPTIQVAYRNITRVFLRAVAYDFDEHIKTQQWGLYRLDDKQRKELLRRKPALEWQVELPATEDYRQRTERLPAPDTLKPGFYFIVASHDRAFAENDNVVSATPVWVSDLALVIRQRHEQAALEGFVLNAITGNPVANAVVGSWTRDRNGHYRPGESTRTDADGLFRFVRQAGRESVVLVAEAAGHKLATGGEYGIYQHGRRPDPFTQTVFFTDRSLYRPGQTIHFKGICIRVDQVKSDYDTLPGQAVTVMFADPNGKEIERLNLRCNDYGAFSGSFTAPDGRLSGAMSIRVVSGPRGATSINVEEYKRPKFQVELDPPKEAAKLNAEVVLTGKATAYTGAAIGGAKVKWRVVREVRFPPWCWWWRGPWWPPGRDASQNIAHGSAVTQADGTFTVRFVARPDLSVPEKDEPVFEFTVHADVTDTTGETRSSRRVVRAGYTALQAAISAADWQTPDKPVELIITTTTLDGEPQPAAGTVRVHALKQPARVVRPELVARPIHWRGGGIQRPETEPNPADPDTWELGEVVSERPFQTDATGKTTVPVDLKAGIYRAMLETKDRFGKPVTARLTVHVVDPRGQRFPVKIANHFAAPKWSVEPGESFVALWGTGYETGRAYVEIEHAGRSLRRYWTDAGRTQEVFEWLVTEEMRGGFTVRVSFVRENRAYLTERIVEVPWSNKQLTVKWEKFRSKLGPGEKETWTAILTGPDAKTVVAEMVAALYDASLDQYKPHDWLQQFGVFRREYSRVHSRFENSAQSFQHILGSWTVESRHAALTYRHFPPELTVNLWGYRYFLGGGFGRAVYRGVELSGDGDFAERMPAKGAAMMADKADAEAGEPAPAPPPEPDLSQVSARQNLNETAFFFPHLVSDADGVVRLEFTMPEALTEWKFLGFAHDNRLRSGFLTDKVVTSKDLMVEPNPPRFVREGDTIEFTVKVTNQTAEPRHGRVRLSFADARTLESRDAALGNANNELAFEVPAKESRSYSWRIRVPDGMDFLTYKAVGATATLSDGEEGYLPVLSRRILVSESLPLPVRGAQTKQFEFARLIESGQSDTLAHQSLSVQMVSQPAWYAVMALPYLMEFPHECSEQIFNRLYANSLARTIANADPKIRRIFDLWKNTPALDSPLEKNQDLKAVMLEETPWLRQAMDESQARRNVGILFDANRLEVETRRAMRQLADMQLGNGLWPWFAGGRGNEYITLYIVTGFGRMRHLGVDIDTALAVRSLEALDGWADKLYRDILKHGDKDQNNLSHTIAFYLYGRSFFLKDKPIAGTHREAIEYWLGQARQYWLRLDARKSQAHLAMALKRFGENAAPAAIMRSIKERSVSHEELGMFWRDLERSWWWYRAPIETQAMMIEAFDEVMNDNQAVEDCKVWLLKQKQTQDWKTTKATADAVYALLLRGQNLLASDALVEVSLAGQPIKPETVEAGTGFYEQRFVRAEIKPDMGRVTVKKTDDGVSWGSVHWQYLEDMTKVTPYEGTPLKLNKTLWTKETTRAGQVLKPVTGPLAVGDELVVRVEVRVDRDMEYVHLKDQRGSGTEPVNVLSGYRFQDGLAYYESTRDTASHFFIDYLPKGIYVFEYSTRIQHKGRYQTGIASIQCMYAPEFNSHSESFALEVR